MSNLAVKEEVPSPKVGMIWKRKTDWFSLPVGPLTQMVRGQFTQEERSEYVLILSDYQHRSERVSAGFYSVRTGWQAYNYEYDQYKTYSFMEGECVGYSNLVRILYGEE